MTVEVAAWEAEGFWDFHSISSCLFFTLVSPATRWLFLFLIAPFTA